MKIAIIVVGSIKSSFIKQGVKDYLDRLGRYTSFEVIEVKDETSSGKLSIEEVKKREASKLSKRFKRGDFKVALADSGESHTSKSFSDFIERVQSSGKNRLCFVVGGAYGLHDSIIRASERVISLSKMTMPHELARLVLIEQIYRAFTIARGEPYSH